MSTLNQRHWLALFADFNDKPCLIVGGGVIAARKAQRLLAAGARLTVVAPELGTTIAALVAEGRITHHCRRYQRSDLDGHSLIVAATDDEQINSAIAEAARALDIPINVAAPGHLSTVTLPKTIDRAPVQIAISSGGASPALMRQLNRHVAALIPQAYGDLAALLAEFRGEITARFDDAEARRCFHDSIIEGPIAEKIFTGQHGVARQMLEDAIRNGTPPAIDHSVPGRVIVSETVKPGPHYQPPIMSSEPVIATAPHFTAADRDSLYSIISARRDMRHFTPNTTIDDEVFARILRAAHQSPSVGLMQPWRFIRIQDAALREQIAALVAVERDATAALLGERNAEFLRLKVEGIRDCAELVVAALAPDDGTIFGRRTMPAEMAICSVASAIENMWLAARAENLGMGWVSMFDPAALAQLLKMPSGSKPLAILSLGPVERFYPAPMLELEGWRQGRPLHEMIFNDHWGNMPPLAPSESQP